MTNSFLLVYASQTGQAKAIAEEISSTAPSYGLKARLFCISLTDRKFTIEKEPCVVFVTSTTGDGEPPETAEKFFRRLNRQTLKCNFLENLNYALLALGDSNYVKFCLFGRQLEQRLKALSAKSFYPTGYGDDAFGIETAVDPWLKNLWPALQKQLGIVASSLPTNESIEMSLRDANLWNIKNSVNGIEESHNLTQENISISDLSSLLNFDVQKCHIPKLPKRLFHTTFETPITNLEHKNHFISTERNFPFQASPLTEVNLIAAKRLTRDESVKRTLELTFKFQNVAMPYLPGDSFGFICINPENEVDILLERLNLTKFCDAPVGFQLLEESVKNRERLPKHIPTSMNLKEIFLHCIEIRSVPKKILLRVFSEYTANELEKNLLLFLSSTEGSQFYTDYVRKPSLSVIDILLNFPSCLPPVELLFEYLPRLKPRFYSVASSPLNDPNTFKIVFNVVVVKKREGRMMDREGVCTGWFERLSAELLEAEPLSNKMSKLKLDTEKTDLFVYKRQNKTFLFPEKLNCPIIMIGPGTGVAPFIGFLQHCEQLKKASAVEQCETWLFFGCRYEDQDYLYRTELERWQKEGILTHLMVSFSRESSRSRYVHDSIRQHGDSVLSSVDRGARVYVCGDARNMSKDVQQAFVDVFQRSSGLTEAESKALVAKLQSDHRYNSDVWT